MLIKISMQDGANVVSARDLYNFLEVTERFSRWAERMWSYGFDLNKDYTPYQNVHPSNNQEMVDYALTLDCAKEIAMIQRSEKGKQARQYFIDCEKQLKVRSSASEIDLIIQQAMVLKKESERIDKIESRLNQIASSPDYFTIAGFGTLREKPVNLKLACDLGKKAAKICRDRGLLMDSIPDPRFGKVRLYPTKVLEEVFSTL